MAMRLSFIASWVIYKNPKDFPGVEYMARLWVSDAKGAHPTSQALIGSIEELEQLFQRLGLVRIQPHRGDDPCIVGSWL